MKLNQPLRMKFNPIQEVLLQQLTVNPSTHYKGHIFYSQAIDSPVYSDGTAYIPMDARKATNIPISALVTNPLSRANHTGTQTASTISDFDTQVRTTRLDQHAAPTTSVSFNSQKITNLANPTAATDAANMQWVQGASTTGNAGTATKLATARTLTLTGLVTSNAISFDGSANVNIPTAIADGSLTIAMVSGLAASISNKQDALGYVPVNRAGDTLTGFLTLHAAPTNNMHPANKQYVDQAIQTNSTGLSVKDPVLAATTGLVTLSGLQLIDTYSLQDGDRVAVLYQGGSLSTPHVDNGLYIAKSGAWIRTTDTLKQGVLFLVSDGLENKGAQYYLQTSGTVTIGTTPLQFTKFKQGEAYTNGNGLILTGQTFSAKPGTGIVVNVAGINIDTTVVARKVTAIFGDGATLTYNITHNLGTKAVTWSLRNTSTDEFELTDVVATTINAISVSFSTAPVSNGYEIVITG